MISFGSSDIVDLSTSKNCLSCREYLNCGEKEKAFNYSCSHFRRFKIEDAVKQAAEATHTKIDHRHALAAIAEPDNPIFSNFNITRTILKAIKDSPIVASDIKINDGDFAEAPNFFTFCVDTDFLGQTPYLEQALLGIIVFAEYCPKCSDTEWMFHTHKATDSLTKLKQKVCLLEHGKCPSCKKNRKKLVDGYGLNYYNEMAVCAGQRSGKSALLGLMFAYLTHRFIKLQNPNDVYGLMRSNVLHCTFVAVTFKQAKDNLWDPFYGNLLESKWFQEYHAMLEQVSIHHGEDLVKLKDLFVQYNHRRLLFYPAGPDKRILRGRTRLGAAIDELGWFDNTADSTKVKINANEIYAALGNSLTTVKTKADKLFDRGFYNIPPAYFLNISSPSSVRDKIMELVKVSQGSRRIYGVLKPTWEMNPDVPKSALAEEFRKDPIAAMRDFGVQPPLASSPFIGHQDLVAGCLSKNKNPYSVTHVIHTSKKKKGHRTRYAKFDKIKPSGKAGILAIDAGFSNNSFVCATGYLKDHRYPVIDGFVEIMPLPGIPINFSLVYKHIILPIIAARNIKIVAADRWNSLKILSDIEEETDAVSLQYSLKYQDMQVFKDHMVDKQLLLPACPVSIDEAIAYNHSDYPTCFKNRPVEHFILQALTVQDTGSSVVKGDQLTDDLMRAGMLAVRVLTDETYAEYFSAEQETAVKPPVSMSEFAIFKGASGGGGSSRAGGAAAGQSAVGMIRQRRDM